MIRKKIAIIFCTLICVLILQGEALGQSTTFSSGTAIIDMGSASPTVQNSLKPYGLIYALLKTKHVPVSVVVNSTKVKDGIDFVYNGKSYKGGTFIVSAEYISSDVTTLLTSWSNQGVLIDYTTGDLTVNVTYKINFIPKWVMDKTNGSIAIGFLNAAGIPSSAYTFKNPSQLNDCDDIFILPHADPTWNAHNNLYFWNKNSKGAIWAGCHAVSVLEGLSRDTTIGGIPTTLKMNFLSTNGLLAFTDHNATTTPFSNLLPGDPVAQYYNKTDGAQILGSETVYLPKTGSAWNSGAKIITSSPLQQDVPSLSPGTPVENIYGRAFDDASRGYVAYQAAHNIGGSTTDQIAAQRVFFNFSLYALNDKVPPIISASLAGNSNQLTAGTATTLTATVTGTGTGLTYQWSASVAGTFSAATSSTTTFTPSSSITSATSCILTCVVTESCGRVSFDSKKITVIPPPSGHTMTNVDINKSIADGCTAGSITFNVFDNNPDPDAGARTLLSVTGLGNGTVLTSTNGDVTFTAAANFKGITTGTFIVTNGASNSPSANINITVGDATLAPSLTNDALTALVDNVVKINVLSNDKNNSTASAGDSLYIRDITTKPSKGYAYINLDGTLSYLSTKDQATIAGGDSFQYLACNTKDYCSVGTVTVTLIQDACSGGQYQITTTGTSGSATFTPTADTYIQGAATGTSSGSNTTMLVFGYSGILDYALVKFDLSSISSTSTVNSSVFSITATTGFAITSNSFNPATIYPVSKAWTEAATWLSYDGTNNWTGSGLSSGSDYSTSSSATITVSSAVAASQVLNSTNMKTMVQGWVTTASTNNGIVILPTSGVSNTGVSNRPAFHTNQTTTAGAAPKLYVNYTTPAACLAISGTTYAPIAYPDTTRTASNASVTINVKSNDANYYGNTNSVTAVTVPAHGTASINGSNNILYTPAGNFVGTDTLTYTITDGSNNQTATATVRITVSKVAPTIVRDNVNTNSGTAVTINVGANDTDPQGSMTAPTISTAPKNGTAAVSGNNIVYTPVAKFTGNDTLIYSRSGTAADACSTALSDTALVVITVLNQAPVASNDSASTFACTPVTIKIKNNDTDPEGDALTVTIVSNPSNGTLAANADGSYTYSPNTNFSGTDQFTYTVKDPAPLTSNTATVKITVSSAANPNTAPSAVADTDNTLSNQPVYTNVLSNDSDPENDPIAISISASGLKAPSNGTIQLMANKLIKYTPNTNFSGTDTYEYQITDTHPGCSGNSSLTSKALVTIKVTALSILAGGTIWNDVDYSATETFTNIRTNSETGTNVNGSIYVYLTDSTNIILDQTSVDDAGVYQLSNVPSNTSKLNLILSKEILSTGGTLSLPSLPSGYTNTSPSVRTFNTGATDITGYDFGIVATTVTGGTISSTSVAFCGSGTPGVIQSTVDATGSTSIQWQSSTTSSGSGFTDIPGASSSTYTPSAAITGTTWYRRKAIGTGGAFAYSNAVVVTINPVPVATISASGTTSLCSGGSVTLTASSNSSYLWSTGATTQSITVSTGGAYSFTATNSNATCSTASAATTVIVNPVPVATITASGPVTFCSGGSVTLTASSNSSYLWSTGATTQSITVSAGGSYSFTATNSNATCSTASAATAVTVNSVPVATITAGGPTTFCSGGSVTLTASSNSSYLWSTGATTQSITVSAAGSYSFTATNSNATCSTASAATTVTVNSVPVATITAGGPTTFCSGGSVTLTASSNSSYLWSTGATTQSITVSAGGSYSFTATNSNATCSTASAATAVTVNSVPVATITAGGPTTFCSGGSVTLTASSNSSYLWSTGATTQSITVSAGGSYSFTATNSNATCSAVSAPATVTVNPLPVANITANGPTAFCSGGSVTLTASSNSSYLWSNGATTQSVTINTSGSHLVTVTNAFGCSATSTASTVTVNSIPVVKVTPTSISVAVGLSTTLTASGAVNYTWSPATNLSATTGVSVLATPAAAGSTAYTVTGTDANGCISTATTTVSGIAIPVAGAISGPCAVVKDSTRSFSVTATNATSYVWTLPNGWTGNSATNSINAKANNLGGTITVVPYNGAIAGTAVSFQVNVIDYAKVTIGGIPVTAAGNKNSSITVTVTLFDANGNRINCSGGAATINLCNPNPGAFTTVIDNNDGTYTSSLTASANTLDICGTIGGIPILNKTTVTFTGPQGSIKGNGPILATETPKLTFTMTAGRSPFTVIYKSAKSNKTDTLTNYTSGTPTGVTLIPSTTLYTLVSIIDANGERRDNNFTRDTATIIVVSPRVVITLKADPAKADKDSTWITLLRVKTKNIGDIDLTNSQAKLDLSTVFPNPVTFTLDSVTYSGNTITPNRNYNGVNSADLFARLNRPVNKMPVDNTLMENNMDMNSVTASPAGSVDGADDMSDRNIRVFTTQDKSGTGVTEGEPVVIEDGNSIYMFGPLSYLPVGVEADMVLYLHVKPNGYTDPFVMQAVALGTGSTAEATALATSLSNDNNDIASHPEITKQGDPVPTVVNLFPRAVIGASLTAGAPVLQGNGTYNVLLSYKLKNYGNVNLQSVQLGLNLLRSIGSPSTFSLAGPLVTTGDLLINPAYDGKVDTNMLAANSILAYNKGEGTVQFTINIVPNQLSSIYRLQATAAGVNDQLGVTVTDLSTDGNDPDPDGNNIPSEKIKTVITINLPIPPLVPGNIGIQSGTATVLTKTFCDKITGVVIVPTSLNSGGSDPYEYQWQGSADNTTFTDIAGATDSIYTSGTVSSGVYVRRQTISGSQFKFSNSVYIQINPLPAKPVITGTGTQIVGKGNVTLTSSTASSYIWSTGAITRSITVTGGGDYSVSITDANGCTNASAAYTIATLDPNKVADLRKVLSKPAELQSDGSFLLGFTVYPINLRPEPLDSVKVKDDLTKVFPATSQFEVVDIKASGNLKANALFNGNSQTDLLNDVSKLGGFQTDSIKFLVKLFANGFSGKLNNVAELTANSPYGSFKIVSDDTTVTRSVTSGGVIVRAPTPFTIPVIDIFIPSGFSPNYDGVNDKFVIIRPFGTTITLEVFNRWGNAVYKAADYKNEWDGRGNQPNNILGEMLPDGTYYYIVTATDKFTGAIRKFAGFITLKR